MFKPCIDIKHKKVVQLEQGERLALTDHRAPKEIAEIYHRDGLIGGHMIDLEGGKNREVILPALSYHNLQVGGGIKLENGEQYLDAGATHLIFSSAVFKREGIDWEMLKKLKSKFGKEKLVLAPDVKGDRYIYVEQWKTKTENKLSVDLLESLSNYCDEFLIHSIEVEGMEGGIDQDLVKFLSEIKGVDIVYAGGGTTLDVVRELHLLGLDMTIGKAYFSGKIKHDDLVELNQTLKGL